MEDAEIIEQILYKLDGWKLTEDIENEDLIDASYNKSISADEVLHFYRTAYNYALTYLGVSKFPTKPVIDIIDGEMIEGEDIVDTVYTALFFWSAGLLWEKYNIRVNNNIDDDNPFGYGDKLIVQAKEMLKPIKSYKFYAY